MSDGKLNVWTAFRSTDELKAQLEETAAMLGLSVSVCLRTAVKEYIQRKSQGQ